jgi:cell division protein FtsX
MQWFVNRPFLRSIVGGAIGMAAVIIVGSLVWSAVTLRQDHVTLQAIVRMINEAQAKQQPPK